LHLWKHLSDPANSSSPVALFRVVIQVPPKLLTPATASLFVSIGPQPRDEVNDGDCAEEVKRVEPRLCAAAGESGYRASATSAPFCSVHLRLALERRATRGRRRCHEGTARTRWQLGHGRAPARQQLPSDARAPHVGHAAGRRLRLRHRSPPL